ncbi:MAG: MauE/DoxX family redox-associated membrane protein [Actinomycetota bacterium]
MMTIGAILFCAFFALSVMGKVDAWPQWRAAVDAWRPHAIPLRLLAVGIPSAEALALILLVTAPRVGILAAAVLLLLLGVGVLALSRAHRGKACNCFGNLSRARIGPGLGLRNLGIAGAGFSIHSFSGSMEVPPFSLVEGLILVLVATLTLLVLEGRKLFGPARRPST